MLEERACGGEDEEGQTDDEREACDEPEGGVAFGRHSVDGRSRERDGETDAGECEQCTLKDDLLFERESFCCRERVGVTGEQRRLKEEQASVPDGGRAAQQRQEHLRHHRLDPEE